MPSATDFGSWFTEHAARLRAMDAEQAADEIGDRVIAIDARLGVDVAEDDDADGGGDRELVITAFSDRAAVPLAKQVAASVTSAPGWKILALEPPQGWEFSVSIGDTELEADKLEFLPDPKTPYAIRLIVPTMLLDRVAATDVEEIAWLIVETGIGEELTSAISEISLGERDVGKPGQPISALAAYVATFRR